MQDSTTDDAFGSFCNKRAFSDVRFSFATENVNKSGTKEGIVIYGHKVILAARSEVFSAMFQSDPHGKFVKNCDICNITDIEPEIFELFLKYIYSSMFDTRNLTLKVALDILYAAKKYMVNGLIRKCESYLNEKTKPDNIHLILNSLHLVSKEINDKLDKLIEQKTSEILRNPSFKDVKVNGLQYLLKQDNLSVPEMDLFNFLLLLAKEKCKRKELSANGENMRQVLGPALTLIRFPTMTNTEFVQKVVPTEILTAEEELWIFRVIANGGTPMILGDNEPTINPGFGMKKRQNVNIQQDNICLYCQRSVNVSHGWNNSGCDTQRRYCHTIRGYY